MNTIAAPAAAMIAAHESTDPARAAYARTVRPHPAGYPFAYTSHTVGESIATCGSCEWTLITPHGLSRTEDRRRADTVANHAWFAHGHR